MKKKQFSFALVILAFVISAAIMPTDVFCAEDAATIDPSKKGSITIEYMTGDGRTPVCGASFVLRRIAEPAADKIRSDGALNGIIWVSLLGTMEPNEYTDADAILKAAKEAYLNGDPKVGGKTYSGLTDHEGKLFIDCIEQGLYVAEEVGSAKGYLESEPFVFSIPYVARKSFIAGSVSGSEGTEDIISIIPEKYESAVKTEQSEPVSDRQYWSYAVYAQPKARKEPEETIPEESIPINPETTEAETAETDTVEATTEETVIPETGTTEVQDTELSSEYETSSEAYTEPYSSESETNTENDIQETTQDIEPTSPTGGKKRDTIVKTGDGSNTRLFVSVSLFSVGIATILAAVIAERRRRQNEKE